MPPEHRVIVTLVFRGSSEAKAWGDFLCSLRGKASLKKLSTQVPIGYSRLKDLFAGRSELTHAEAETLLAHFGYKIISISVEGPYSRREAVPEPFDP